MHDSAAALSSGVPEQDVPIASVREVQAFRIWHASFKEHLVDGKGLGEG